MAGPAMPNNAANAAHTRGFICIRPPERKSRKRLPEKLSLLTSARKDEIGAQRIEKTDNGGREGDL
jgi:hypothetical protein